MTLVRSSHLRAGERAHGAAVPRRLQQRHGAGGALLLTPHLRAVPRPLAKAKPHRLQREWIEWMVWIVSNLLWFVVVYCDFITFHYFNLLQLIWQNKSLRHMSKKVADWRSCATHECLHLLDRFGPWSKKFLYVQPLSHAGATWLAGKSGSKSTVCTVALYKIACTKKRSNVENTENCRETFDSGDASEFCFSSVG